MRVGLFHSTLPETGRKPGGVEVFVHRLGNRLADRGHDVSLFSFAPQPPGDARYALRKVGREGIATSAGLRLTLGSMLLNRVNWTGLDVLHLHGDDWFFLQRPVPTVRTFHGSALHEARSATRLRRRLSQYAVFAGEIAASRLAKGSYAVGPGMPRLYRLDGILPIAVELAAVGDHAHLTTSDSRSSHPTVLFVGTWLGRKRGRFLRDKFISEVLPLVPGAELWMVSDICEEAEGVRWIRFPSDDELAELYSQAWVFCMPSLYEGFGIPYVEAMAHGAAVVASPNPGSRWVTDGGRAGRLCDDEELGSTISELLLRPDLRNRLAKAGLRRAQDFAWDRACAEHEKAYAGAIAKSTNSAAAITSDSTIEHPKAD